MSKTHERIRNSQLRYKRGLGQNFLYDETLLASLVMTSGITSDDDVLEIGPGAGTLTKQLCMAAHHVDALELDERLIPLLQAYMADFPNFTLYQGDVMTADLPALTQNLQAPFHVIANIPYYITTPLIQLLLSSDLPIGSLSLMVQKEVADKILASPGQDPWCMLSVRCQYACLPKLAMEIPASAFTPVPKVDSAFVVMPVRDTPAVHPLSEKDFFRIAEAGFALRRKTMVNCLCAALHLERSDASALMEAAGLDARVRGETLSLQELARLSDAYTVMNSKNTGSLGEA